MTPVTKRRLIFRCALAVALAVALAGLLALRLSMYANDEDPRGSWTAAADAPVAFPDSDAQLQDMADRLLGERLDRTEPAAGRK